MAQQTNMTAVEFLIEQLMERGFIEKNYEIIEQAKQMEKKQIIDAWKHGNGKFDKTAFKLSEQYYNETYEK